MEINLFKYFLVCVLFWYLSDNIRCCLFVNAFISGIAQLRPQHHLSRAELALSSYLAYVCPSVCHTLAKPPSNLESRNLAQVSALGGR